MVDQRVLQHDLGERLGDPLDEQELASLDRVDEVAGEAVVDRPLEVVGERRVAQRRAIEPDLDAQRLRRRALGIAAADPARNLEAFEEEHVHHSAPTLAAVAAALPPKGE